ncbi:hypothetical protein LCGC14_1115650 [marine sediment metagenome]|uniref:Uncharacterized protein n=1 Tax=marine sediment metagenome TaxID=412755 RepID=A0A0F9M5E4_9ZZZZ
MAAIEVRETALIIHSSQMVPNRPYTFTFLGVKMIAIRDPKGEVNLYEVVDKEDK